MQAVQRMETREVPAAKAGLGFCQNAKERFGFSASVGACGEERGKKAPRREELGSGSDGEKALRGPADGEKARFLSRYRQADLRIQRKCGEMSLWRQRALLITPLYSKAPGGRGGDRLQSAVERICEIEEEINRDIDELVEIRREVQAAIHSVGDLTLETLLELRYIDGLTWEELAEKMHYTYQWVCKLHGRALKRLRFPGERKEEGEGGETETVDSN